jgi:bifunctional DNA-binding transcriptional regulator/antitoxin component of YhaV-PrlF toxin-antitoxin module
MTWVRSSLKKIRSLIWQLLRFIFEDKQMKGQNFGHLNVRNGMLYVDEESEAWQNMLPKILQDPRVDDFERIVLPLKIRKELKNTDIVEFWKISEKQYVVLITKPDPVNRSKLDKLLAETPKDSNLNGWH